MVAKRTRKPRYALVCGHTVKSKHYTRTAAAKAASGWANCRIVKASTAKRMCHSKKRCFG